MNKEVLNEVIREYLKENLEICVWTEKHYGDYGNADGVKVTVTLNLEGEELTSSYDYTGL